MLSVSIYSTCDTVALVTVLWAGGGWEVFFDSLFLKCCISPRNKASVFGTKYSKLEVRLQKLL